MTADTRKALADDVLALSAPPEREDRQTFNVPDGYEAVRDADGRATGEVRPTQPVPPECEATSTKNAHVPRSVAETGENLADYGSPEWQWWLVQSSEFRQGVVEGLFRRKRNDQ